MRNIDEELANKIKETFQICFERHNLWKIINNYLRPAFNNLKGENLLGGFDKISDFAYLYDKIRGIPDSMVVQRSLLYRLLYLQTNPEYISREGKQALNELYVMAQAKSLLPLYENQVEETGALSDAEIQTCINNAVMVAPYIVDRETLRPRDYLERFIDVVTGEVAELMVIKWFKDNGKFAESAVDKTSARPDLGHDIILKDRSNNKIKCSVKSSIAALRNKKEVLLESTLGTTEREIRQVNIQVFFWYNVYAPKQRLILPNSGSAGIFSWAGNKDISDFTKYATEERQCPTNKLCELRSMRSILELLS